VVTLRRAALALVVAAVAGATVPAVGSTSTRHFSRPIHVDVSAANATGEPSIAVARDGTEYIVAPDGAGVRTPNAIGAGGSGGSLIWRSPDRGRTWTFLGNYDLPTGGGDTDVAVMPNGTVVASGLSSVACATVAVSTDKAQSWRADPLAGCATFPLMNDRQWTAVDGNNTVYTVIGNTVEGELDLVRAKPGVLGVTPTTTLQLYTGGDYEWPGTIALNSRDGTAYVVWNTTGSPDDCDGTSGDSCTPAAASSKTPDLIEVSVVPRGATAAPTPRVVASRHFDTYDSFVTDAVDSAGNVYVVWSERHPAQRETWIMLSTSHNRGRSWSAPQRINRVPSTTTYPWVTAGDAGRIAISYYGTSAHGYSPQTVPSGATWYVYSTFSTDGGRHFAEYRTTGPIQHGMICTSGTGCAAGTRNLLDFFETAADPQGCLVTSYADNSANAGAAVVSYVRQTSGPGLSARRPCR